MCLNYTMSGFDEFKMPFIEPRFSNPDWRDHQIGREARIRPGMIEVWDPNNGTMGHYAILPDTPEVRRNYEVVEPPRR